MTLKGHEGFVSAVAFSPDGKTLATGGGDRSIKFWDVGHTSKTRNVLKGHAGTVHSVTFSPDGKTLATGSADKTIKLWDVGVQRELATLKGHEGSVRSIAFSPDGMTLAAGGGERGEHKTLGRRDTTRVGNVERP